MAANDQLERRATLWHVRSNAANEREASPFSTYVEKTARFQSTRERLPARAQLDTFRNSEKGV